MMKAFAGLAVLAAAGLTAIRVLGGSGDTVPAPSDGADENAFFLQLPDDQARCRLEKGLARDPVHSDLQVGADCPDVFPGIADARSWEDRRDGTVALLDESGHPVLVFAVSDGFAYESIEPAAPMLVLAAAE